MKLRHLIVGCASILAFNAIAQAAPVGEVESETNP